MTLVDYEWEEICETPVATGPSMPKDFEHEAGTRSALKNYPRVDVSPKDKRQTEEQAKPMERIPPSGDRYSADYELARTPHRQAVRLFARSPLILQLVD